MNFMGIKTGKGSRAGAGVLSLRNGDEKAAEFSCQLKTGAYGLGGEVSRNLAPVGWGISSVWWRGQRGRTRHRSRRPGLGRFQNPAPSKMPAPGPSACRDGSKERWFRPVRVLPARVGRTARAG